MSEFLDNYFQNRFFNIGLKEALDKDLLNPLTAPLLPFANPFAERKKPRFPVPSDFRKPIVPDIEMDVPPQTRSDDSGTDFYSPGYDPTTGKKREEPSVEAIDPKEGMASYVIEEKVPETGIKGMINAIVQKEFAFQKDFNPITATMRNTDISGVMGNLPMGAFGSLGSLTAIGSELNKRNMSDIAARAALGQKGYAVGMFDDNKLVGTKPNVPIPQGGSVPSALQNKVVRQLQELGEQGKGRGVLGKAFDQYMDRGARFNMSKRVTPEMIAYESVVKGLKVDDDLKQQLLGFGTTSPAVEFTQNYYTMTPYEQIQKDIKAASDFRDTLQTDEGSMGLETDITAQTDPFGILGLNPSEARAKLNTIPEMNYQKIDRIMKDFKDPTSGFYSLGSDNVVGSTGNLGDGSGGPRGGAGGLDVSSTVSRSYYSDNESGDNRTSGGGGSSGFGGGGWTAYGGKIGMSNGGFASKTQTIKGVGLIKPEETFMDTDVVRDRYEFPAENGDYIVNGPSSSIMQPQVAALIDYGINQLKKEGVDIRVGNPKIKGKNKVPLVVASSETYIPRVIAEKIGYPILDALNNIGKPEVRRLKNKLDNKPTDKGKYEANEGMRVGEPIPNSFMTMEEADKALGVKPEPIDPNTLKFFKLYNKKGKPQRGDVERLLDSLNDKDKLALLIATETISSKDPLETLESVGQVVINRINDKQFPDFKNVNTLDQVLKQRSSRGGGTKMFQFDGLEPTSVKKRINEFLNKGGIKGYRRALTAAENVLTKGSGEPDYMMERMPFNVLFYDKAGSPTSISRRYKKGKDVGPNELIDEYGKVGDHTFYTLHMTREYP